MTLFHSDGEVVADAVDSLIVAGWTGRDTAGVEHHVRELAAIGVAPPSTIPLFYRVSAALLGTHGTIEVVGTESSGEVEPLIVRAGGRLWLGVASDHTDRALEAHSVALSKQICAKPCAADLWPLDDVAARLDTLELRAWIADDIAAADWTLYQEGSLAAIRPLAELIEASPLGTADDAGRSAMLCGTLGAIGGVRPAGACRIELLDPRDGRSIRHEYAVVSLPEIR